ncbi:serine hydrolase domain-containing protein [Dermatobacter hominis]|uniref:serine hydrolase domain-containing protein n=1 Tax=Dermatobacter hominis TaxID=2884263 RepID=UPI001D0FBBFC|nr:serine hydrolase [Dermatobacter hominis]UDY35340.1 serine hydrolase [Dermatobacter hominis]
MAVVAAFVTTVGASACSAGTGPLASIAAARGDGTRAGATDGAPAAPPDVAGPAPEARCAETPAGVEPERVDPAAVGLDAEQLRSALDYAVAKGSQSVRVYRHGCLVGAGSNDPLVDWVPLPGWSMTKGIVSVLVGRAVELGALDVDDAIGEHLQVTDPRKAALTVRELLNQTTGLRLAWASDLNEAATTDSAAALLARPFEAVPGTTFNYAQTTVTLLVAVVEAAVGEDLQAFAQRELFGPIGITHDEWLWERDGAGRSQGFAFLRMTPTAFGRLGRLLLQDGTWAGRRLLPSDYIAQGRTGTAANPCYGFLWRNNDGVGCRQTGPMLGLETAGNWMPTVPSDAYGLSGMFDQLVLVIPSLDAVVVRLGLPPQALGDPWGDVGGERPSMTWRFFRTLMGAVTDMAVADPGDWTPKPPDAIDWSHILDVPLPEPTW